MNDKFQILRDFANSNDKPDKTIYQFVKEVLDTNSAYAKELEKYKNIVKKVREYLNKNEIQPVYLDCKLYETDVYKELLEILDKVGDKE